MAPNHRARWSALALEGILAAGLLGGGGCLSMPTGGPDARDGAASLVPDSFTGTWLVSVDTANLAPFEVTLFKALDDSGSPRLLGVSHIPEFASRMGMNVIRTGPLWVTLAQRDLAIHGLTLGDRRYVFAGSVCGRDLCGALV